MDRNTPLEQAALVFNKLSASLINHTNLAEGLDDVLDTIVNEARALMGIEKCALMLIDPDEPNILRVRASSGLSDKWNEFWFNVGESISGYTVSSKEVQIIPDLEADARRKYAHTSDAEVRSMLSVPIMMEEQAIGVFNFYHKDRYDFSEHEVNMYATMTNYAATAIALARKNEALKNHDVNLVWAMVKAIEAKNYSTRGHSDRVTGYSLRIGMRLGLSKSQLSDLRQGARIHDIGKLYIKDDILDKPGKLTEKEWEIMRGHPMEGVKIVQHMEYLKRLIPSIRNHHERYDGKGYPDGLSGNDIPLMGRIICVADSFDAMTYTRPYREGMPVPKAIEELKRCAGFDYDKNLISKGPEMQFDPEIVEAFIATKPARINS